jgi:hypothetical protein
MGILCRTFGHRPARDSVQRDMVTFALHGRCSRCRIPIVRDEQGWREETTSRDADET